MRNEKMKCSVKTINDVLGCREHGNRLMRMIRCEEIDAEFIGSAFSSDMYMDATVIILVVRGGIRFEINRREVAAGAGSIAALSASHLFRAVSCTGDFRGICLAAGEEFMTETDSADMIYRRIRYGVKLYDNPVVTLGDGETALLRRRLSELREALLNSSHLYWRDVVLNRLFAFYLDLSDIIDRSSADSEYATRYESIVKRFIELLRVSYRAEHKVDFYAGKLNLSAHYLTQIVKEITGRTVSDFIYGMLYGDARALLSDTGMSVQEITAVLNFSDQSSFGKFFKRRSGLSPAAYRKKR